MSELIEQKIAELNRQLLVLKQERDNLNNEAKIWAEKRNDIHRQMQNLRQQAAGIKEKRDFLNKRVQELKGLREKAKTERGEKRAQIVEKREKLRAISERKPFRDLNEIEKELESLEWKIQTTPMSVKEEKELIERVKTLETQRNVHKQLEELRNELAKLLTEEKELENKAKVAHQKLSELAKQSQEFHKEMLKISAKIRTFMSEADEAHQKYVEIRKRATEARHRYTELLSQVEALRQEIHEKEEKKQAQRQKELREEAVRKAREKAGRGKKLSLQEFQLLVEEEFEQNIKES